MFELPSPLGEGPGVRCFDEGEGPGMRCFDEGEGPGVRYHLFKLFPGKFTIFQG
jgi:hypothetical protein